VAFVIDVFSRRIVGWRTHTTMRSELVLNAIEQALHDREMDDSSIHHSARGVQHLSMRHRERLADAGIALSVGSRGDSYDNALAESVIGLYKAEVIHRDAPWRLRRGGARDARVGGLVQHATLAEPLGYLPPAEYEAQYHRSHARSHRAGWSQLTEPPEFPGRSLRESSVRVLPISGPDFRSMTCEEEAAYRVLRIIRWFGRSNSTIVSRLPRQFVYDADFLHTPHVAVDSAPIGIGTTASTIAAVYPAPSLVEYHWPGRDPSAGGMDGRSLWRKFLRAGAAIHGGISWV
jgi:hypothetical protein